MTTPIPDTVRLILQPYALGFPRLDPGGAAALRSALATARAHRLDIQLSLFDGWREYRRVDGSRQWLREVLADQDGVGLIELQHRIDLGRPGASAWATALLAELAERAPGAARTLSAPLITPGYVLAAFEEPVNELPASF